MFDIFKKRFRFIINDSDLMSFLEILNKYQIANSNYPNCLSIGYCAWANEPNRMYLHVRTTTKMMREIILWLCKRGITDWYIDIPVSFKKGE